MTRFRRNQKLLGMRIFTTSGRGEYRHLNIQIERYVVMDAVAEWKHQVKHSMSKDGPKHWKQQMEEVVELTGGSSIYFQDVYCSEFELIWQDDMRRRNDWYACKLEAGSIDETKLRDIRKIFKGISSSINARDMFLHLREIGVVPVKYVRYGLYLPNEEFDIDDLCPAPSTLEHNQTADS